MKKIIILLLILSVCRLSASSIIINSIIDRENNPESGIYVLAVEDGLMDMLFESGVIIFSTENSKSYSVEGAADAGLMISLEILEKEYCVSFKLQSSKDGNLVESGTVDLSQIPHNSLLEEKQLYSLIGEKIGERIEQFL